MGSTRAAAPAAPARPEPVGVVKSGASELPVKGDDGVDSFVIRLRAGGGALRVSEGAADRPAPGVLDNCRVVVAAAAAGGAFKLGMNSVTGRTEILGGFSEYMVDGALFTFSL